jgi:hypothetical protein
MTETQKDLGWIVGLASCGLALAAAIYFVVFSGPPWVGLFAGGFGAGLVIWVTYNIGFEHGMNFVVERQLRAGMFDKHKH